VEPAVVEAVVALEVAAVSGRVVAEGLAKAVRVWVGPVVEPGVAEVEAALEVAAVSGRVVAEGPAKAVRV
jgi:hypothetical protein